MKAKFLVLSLIILAAIGFIVAENYQGDGTHLLNKGDSIIMDNGYKLILTNIQLWVLGATNEEADYYFDIYKGDNKLENTSFRVFNFGTSNYSIKLSTGETIGDIAFTAGSKPENSQVTITSLGSSVEKETAGQETQKTGDENSANIEEPGFFKRVWNWFKCLFSKEC